MFIVFVALFLWFIWYSKGKKYSAASLVLKLLMSAGILYSLVFYYLPCGSREENQRSAPAVENGLFLVPKVIE